MTNKIPDIIYAYNTETEHGTGTWIDFDDSCKGDEATVYTRKNIADKRIAELEERLEIDKAYTLDGDEVEFQKDWPDGIDCRDETIKLLESHITELKCQMECNESYIKKLERQNTDLQRNNTALITCALRIPPSAADELAGD